MKPAENLKIKVARKAFAQLNPERKRHVVSPVIDELPLTCRPHFTDAVVNAVQTLRVAAGKLLAVIRVDQPPFESSLQGLLQAVVAHKSLSEGEVVGLDQKELQRFPSQLDRLISTPLGTEWSRVVPPGAHLVPKRAWVANASASAAPSGRTLFEAGLGPSGPFERPSEA